MLISLWQPKSSFMHDAEECYYHMKAIVTVLDHSFGLYLSKTSQMHQKDAPK